MITKQELQQKSEQAAISQIEARMKAAAELGETYIEYKDNITNEIIRQNVINHFKDAGFNVNYGTIQNSSVVFDYKLGMFIKIGW